MSSTRMALVTGAARRVGRAIALEMAAADCDVAVHCLSSVADGDDVVRQIQAMGRRAILVQGDLTDPAVPDRLVTEVANQLGGLDILVNSASMFEGAAIEDWDERHWLRTLQVNAIAPAMLARAAAPLMRRAGRGRIVNITDILAERPMRGYTAYCASKAALVNITKSLARELAPHITVNAVAPGIAVFPEHYDEPLRAELIDRVPLKRAGSPGQIAATVRFLVTTADYITGQVINVDGGRSIVP